MHATALTGLPEARWLKVLATVLSTQLQRPARRAGRSAGRGGQGEGRGNPERRPGLSLGRGPVSHLVGPDQNQATRRRAGLSETQTAAGGGRSDGAGSRREKDDTPELQACDRSDPSRPAYVAQPGTGRR